MGQAEPRGPVHVVQTHRSGAMHVAMDTPGLTTPVWQGCQEGPFSSFLPPTPHIHVLKDQKKGDSKQEGLWVRWRGVQVLAVPLTSPTDLDMQFCCSEPVFSPAKRSFQYHAPTPPPSQKKVSASLALCSAPGVGY